MTKEIIYIGLALACSSVLLTNFRLYELDRYLKKSEKDLWDKYGFGNDKLNLMTKLYRLRKLATEYNSEDLALSRRLQVFSLLQILTVIGLGVVLVGVAVELFQYA